jgi:hypothetical protein
MPRPFGAIIHSSTAISHRQIFIDRLRQLNYNPDSHTPGEPHPAFVWAGALMGKSAPKTSCEAQCFHIFIARFVDLVVIIILPFLVIAHSTSQANIR